MQEATINRLPKVAPVVRLDCGHVPPVTEPERFAAVLKSIDATL